MSARGSEAPGAVKSRAQPVQCSMSHEALQMMGHNETKVPIMHGLVQGEVEGQARAWSNTWPWALRTRRCPW